MNNEQDPKSVQPDPISTEEHFKIAADQLVVKKLEELEDPKTEPENMSKIPEMAQPKKDTPKDEITTPVDQKQPDPTQVVHPEKQQEPQQDKPGDLIASVLKGGPWGATQKQPTKDETTPKEIPIHREAVKQAMRKPLQSLQTGAHAHHPGQKPHPHQHERPKPGCRFCSGKGFYHVATTINGKPTMQATPCMCARPKQPITAGRHPRPQTGPRRR